MSQNSEAAAFLARITQPGLSLDAALQPSLDDEAALRKLFATDKTHARVQDPHAGLVDVYRQREPDLPGFTWWDYRLGAFNRDWGMRIDLALVGEDVAGRGNGWISYSALVKIPRRR